MFVLLLCLAQLAQPGRPLVGSDVGLTIDVPTPAALQGILDTAPPGTTIRLQPGETYRSVRVSPSTFRARRLTLTTKGWAADRLVRPEDASALATIQSGPGGNYGLWVMADDVTLQGLRFSYNPPSGQGDMLRLGDSEDPVVANVPARVTVRQVLFEGNPGNVFGQKRAIAANAQDTVIDQVWCQDIWIAGQDSQCVAIASTPGRVTVRRSVLSAGSETIIIGGVPPASPAHLPADILIEDNVLWKPLTWKGASPARQVKNLFEIKFGRRITVRRNWMENHWQQAQPGWSVVLTMATNGTCSFCDMQDVTFEDNVVWNVSAGINLTGYQYSYAPGSGQAVRFTIRNNLFYITGGSGSTLGGNGRPVQILSEPADLTFDRNTFIHTGTAVVYGTYGAKWPYQDPPLTSNVPAGPVQGFVWTNNMHRHANYGILTPEGNSGVNALMYFPSAVIGGNVFAGASSTAMSRYNTLDGDLNFNPTLADFEASFRNYATQDFCIVAGPFAGKGADCARLPFALRTLVPR